MVEGRKRAVIENVKPEINSGVFPIKRVISEKVVVEADIFSDGHDSVSGLLLYKKHGASGWQESPMRSIENDRWRGEFIVEEPGMYYYTLQGWIDHFKTWQKDLRKKFDAGQDISVDILIGVQYIEEASARALDEEKKKLKKFADLLRSETDREEVFLLAMSKEVNEMMERYADRQFATFYEKELPVFVDRKKALFSSWYEIFPRSCTPDYI